MTQKTNQNLGVALGLAGNFQVPLNRNAGLILRNVILIIRATGC